MAAGPFDTVIIAEHRGKTAGQVAELGVDALSGVSAADRVHLMDALDIATVGDLGGNRFVRTARAIAEHGAGMDHDPGPDVTWSALFAEAPLATYRAHPTSFRLDFGPAFYRGRLNGTARVVIVGQDPAANELVGHRAFVGTSGQRIQGFLRRLGVRRDYLMVNTFLYPVFGQFIGDLRELTRDPQILGYRNRLLDHIADQNAVEVVIAVGAAARDALERWPGAQNLESEHITHPSAQDHTALLADWNDGLARLRAIVQVEAGTVRDETPYGTDFTAADHEPIPRHDLPFGVPEWHGVNSHARRGRLADGSTNHKEIIWTAP